MNGVGTAPGTHAEDAAPPTAIPPNPFVGPVPLDEGQKLYGRRRETADLAALLVSKRIVLLFSPSGAGKTSLIRAGLMPRLRADYDIEALPVVRLGYRDPDWMHDPTINRYRVAMLYALEKRREDSARRPASELCGYTLRKYFDECVLPGMGRDKKGGNPNYPLLIIDQFEELFTADALDVDKKREFLEELGDLLRGDASSRWGGETGAPIWALFSIREDRVAELQPYLDLIPTSLSFRHRLDALDVEEANEAIRETAGDVWMSDDVPQRLVEDLCTVLVPGPDGRETPQPGRFVEPVQLQVVCRGLWNKIVARLGRKIVANDVESHEHSEVDRALREFFDDEVGAAASHAGVSERKLREWIESRLISPSGVRTQTLRDRNELGPSDKAIAKLVDAHLLRSDRRAGREWIELPHDRLVAPVRAANHAWARTHFQPFQVRARHWHEASGEHARRLLLPAEELEVARAYAQDHCDDLTETEADFLEASTTEVQRREQQRRERRRTGIMMWGSAAAIVIVLALWGIDQRQQKVAEQEEAARAELRSEVNQKLSRARESGSTGATLALLLSLRDDARRADPQGSLPRRVDNAIRQQLTRSRAAVLHELQPRGHVVWSLAFTPDGDRLLAGSWDGRISLQDVENRGARAFETADQQSETYAVALHAPSGVVASTHQDGRVLLWRLQGDGLRRIAVLVPDPQRRQMTTADISPDGRWLVAAGWGKKVDVWDITDPAVPVHKATLAKSVAPIQSITFVPGFGPDGQHVLASTDYDGKVYLWSVGERMPERGTPFRGFSVSDHENRDIGISASAADPSGRYFVAGDTEGSVHVWDLAAPDAPGIRLKNASHRGGPQDTHVKDIAFAPKGREFTSVGLDGHVVRWTLPAETKAATGWGTTNITVQRFRMDERLFSVAYRPDVPGQVAIGGTRAILLLDLERGAGPALSSPVPDSHASGSWRMLSMDATGARIAASDRAGPIRFWRRVGKKLAPVKAWTLPATRPFAFALTPDGTRIVTVGCQGNPSEWMLPASGAPRQASTAEAAPAEVCEKRAATAPVFSPDGRFLATADNNTLRLWSRDAARAGRWREWTSRALTWDVPDTTETRRDPIAVMAFSADANYLAVGAASGTVRLWDMRGAPRASGFAVVAATDVGKRVNALTFHPGGKALRAGGEDGFLTECSIPALRRMDVNGRHERRIIGAAFSTAGADADQVLVTADADGQLVKWSHRTRDADLLSATDLAGEGSPPVYALALSKDGTFLVTAGDGLFAWDLTPAHVLATAQAYVARTRSSRASTASRSNP